MSKYKHAVYYGTGHNDPTPRNVGHYEDSPHYGPIIKEVYRTIDEAHALKRGAVSAELANPRSRATLASYFQRMGFQVTQHVEDDALMTIRWKEGSAL